MNQMGYLYNLLVEQIIKLDRQNLLFFVENRYSLIRWILKKYPIVKMFAKMYSKQINEEISLLTVQKLQMEVWKKRPDLVDVVKTTKFEVWLLSQIFELKDELQKLNILRNQ